MGLGRPDLEDTHAGGRGMAGMPGKRNLAASGLARRSRASTESFRLQIRLIFERLPVTAEVSSLAPVLALLPGLPVYDSRIFGAHRDSLLGSGQKESGR